MSTKGSADIVFCMDASASMAPCIDGVRRHVGDLVRGISSNPNSRWDVRLDFVAHCAGMSMGRPIHSQRSIYNPCVVDALYAPTSNPNGGGGGRFFTSDVNEFCTALDAVQIFGDEAPLFALDAALDYPWRPKDKVHRVVILMTDERPEDGVAVEDQRQQLRKLIDKIQKLRVMLFIVAPPSPMFDELSAVDRAQYEVVEGREGQGLSQVDFRKLLDGIGRSVSMSTLQTIGTTAESVERGIFGQATWVNTNEAITGA